jgi:hypothetical protein
VECKPYDHEMQELTRSATWQEALAFQPVRSVTLAAGVASAASA